MISLRSIPLQLTLLATAVLSTSSIAQARLVDYGDQHLNQLKKHFQQGDLHILQIGDSHTAGDYFTEQLRKRLQDDIGDGGIGFAYPNKIKGQRTARHDYKTSEWDTDNSRFNRSGGNYPIGGIKTTANSQYDTLTITSQYYANDTQDADIVVNGRKGQKLTLSNIKGDKNIRLNRNGWQSVQGSITFPTTIHADTGVSIGGFWLKRPQGGQVSAMGINGATQSYWNRWHSNLAKTLSFAKADLVILAYGTNEAFRSNAKNLTKDMTRAIKKIRKGLPNASILVLGAPESLKSTAGQCGTRATSLDSVQSQLQRIAQDNNTLYWSWQEAMGGRCSMKSWVDQGLAARDGVHFSRGGYNRVANKLYDELNSLFIFARSNKKANTNNQYQATQSQQDNFNNNYQSTPLNNVSFGNYQGSTFRPKHISLNDIDSSIFTDVEDVEIDNEISADSSNTPIYTDFTINNKTSYDDNINNTDVAIAGKVTYNDTNTPMYHALFAEGVPQLSDFE